jgi:hypothetical protein
MRPSRAILFWTLVLAVLVVLELAEVFKFFTLGYVAVLANPLAFIFSIVLITILALVGALFIGIYIAHRILSPQGFTPFEEEMLHMREDVSKLREEMDGLARSLRGGPEKK